MINKCSCVSPHSPSYSSSCVSSCVSPLFGCHHSPYDLRRKLSPIHDMVSVSSNSIVNTNCGTTSSTSASSTTVPSSSSTSSSSTSSTSSSSSSHSFSIQSIPSKKRPKKSNFFHPFNEGLNPRDTFPYLPFPFN